MQEGQPIIVNTANNPSNVQVASLKIKSDSEFRTIRMNLKKIDGIIYCQYPDLSALASLDPKIVLMRKPRKTCKKKDASNRAIKHGWVVCSKSQYIGQKHTMSIVNAYLRDAWEKSQDAYHALQPDLIENHILDNYIDEDVNRFTSSRQKEQNALFGICLRIDNPAYNGLKDGTTTSYYGVPRYLFSQVTPFRASIYQNEGSETIHIGIGIL